MLIEFVDACRPASECIVLDAASAYTIQQRHFPFDCIAARKAQGNAHQTDDVTQSKYRYQTKDVDLVLTTTDVELLLEVRLSFVTSIT